MVQVAETDTISLNNYLFMLLPVVCVLMNVSYVEFYIYKMGGTLIQPGHTHCSALDSESRPV